LIFRFVLFFVSSFSPPGCCKPPRSEKRANRHLLTVLLLLLLLLPLSSSRERAPTRNKREKELTKASQFYYRAMEPSSATPPPPPSSFRHPWSRDQFRANAHAAVDFIVSYLERLEQPSPPWAVTSQVEPGFLRPRLPASAPERPDGGAAGEEGGGFSSFLADVEAHILPGLTHWQSPNFFSYFPANSSLPGLVGEMLCAAFNVIGFSWAGSPAATELEAVVLDWVARALGLPERFLSPDACAASRGGGCIQSTASDAVLVALLAARARALAPPPREGEGARDVGGASAPPSPSPPPPLLPGSHNEDAEGASRLVVYTSEQAHCCVKKACMVAGIPFSRVREIAAPESGGFEIDAPALRAALEQDLEEGLVPCLVVATVGTTPTCAVDDLKAVAAAIDAAYEAAREKEEEKEGGRGEEERLEEGDGGVQGGDVEGGGEKEQTKRRPLRRPWLHVDAAYAGVSALCPEYRDIFEGAERFDSLSTNFHKW
jgi:tyrosine decarboxylase